MEIETDKATLDVPSGVAGTITSLHVAEGQTITPGTVLITVLEGAGAESGGAPPAAPPPPSAAPPATSAAPPPAPAGPPPAPAGPPRAAATPLPDRGGPASVPEDVTQRAVFASPSVRKFARQIGVDVRAVTGSGPAGRIAEEDVKRFRARRPQRARVRPQRRARPAAPPARLLPLGPDRARAPEPLPAHRRAQHVAGLGADPGRHAASHRRCHGLWKPCGSATSRPPSTPAAA